MEKEKIFCGLASRCFCRVHWRRVLVYKSAHPDGRFFASWFSNRCGDSADQCPARGVPVTLAGRTKLTLIAALAAVAILGPVARAQQTPYPKQAAARIPSASHGNTFSITATLMGSNKPHCSSSSQTLSNTRLRLKKLPGRPHAGRCM